ncbi:MAG: hypothetical protein LBM94_03985 [Propionibacteriaceae bacterium]|nr:hypothetical protein [Propionibacteriaceae bacterium]
MPLLSSELATLASGRYVELPLLPLSFAESVAGRRQRVFTTCAVPLSH